MEEGDDVKLKDAASLPKPVDVAEPMEEGNDVK